MVGGSSPPKTSSSSQPLSSSASETYVNISCPMQTIVASHAARLIVDLLNDNVRDASSSIFVSDDDCLDLKRLTVNQLKIVAKKLNATEEFRMPRSGARKYEWVDAIADFFFRQNFGNEVINSAGTSSGKVTGTSIAKAQVSSKATTTTSHKDRKPAAKKSCARVNRSTNLTVDSDEAMARVLQQQYTQEDIRSQVMALDGIHPASVGTASCCFDGVKTDRPMNGAQLPPFLTTTEAAAGLKRPANPSSKISAKQQRYASVKVKKEPPPANSTDAHSLSHEEDSDRPRDIRESSLLDTMRNMGFSDNREILSGIRAVAVAGWSAQEHVEAAMMWIISQREEAAEARKEDEARVSSLTADAEMIQLRKDERELEMMSSDLTDVLGSVEEEIGIDSKYFPHSVILQSGPTRQMFATIASMNDSAVAAHARKEVLRYLKLEKKASDWYGRFLPYSFFHHSAKSRFESWAEELMKTSGGYSDQISQWLTKECDELEKALYNLSEQEETGMANVPKVFIQAQRDAQKKGLPIEEKRDLDDDDIEVIDHPISNTVSVKKQQPMDVIEIL